MMPLAALDRVSVAFGHVPLLDDASLRVERGERVAILGRNGAGKSTLLRILSGELAPDLGSVWREPGVQVARLDQDVPLISDRTAFEVVADGLGALSDLLKEYHQSAVHVAEQNTAGALERLGRVQHEMDKRDAWRVEQRVEFILARLDLPADVRVDTLSGGWKRRLLLARTLVAAPEVLLLDEPTNHLDLEAIAWLETFLTEYQGAVVFVTHDRTFLQNVATRIVEIDRARLTSWPGDYATFLRKKDEWQANEEARQDKFDKRLKEEEAWLRQGVKARRTRDEGRVRALIAMRRERAARREKEGSVRMRIEQARASGEVVFDVDSISKTFGSKAIVRNFSTRIMRGDRVGLIGPNGAGKTTVLRLLLGEMAPDEGGVQRGANVEIAYYDQQREQLDPEQTVFDTVADGNDTVTVNGRSRHVNAYLRDFLFPLERAQSPVKSLSGGERNRLLLARLFTRAANVLVLDEPTNDLDLETLELLEQQLVAWPGTLLLVSHDRFFLDNVVTSTLVFEGGGVVQEYVGGYEDWQRQIASVPAAVQTLPAASDSKALRAAAPAVADGPKRLSYSERRELDGLPARIEALETEQQMLNSTIAAPDFYRQPAATINEAMERVQQLGRELTELYARWEALESRVGVR